MEEGKESSNFESFKISWRGFKEICQWVKEWFKTKTQWLCSLAKKEEKVYPRNFSKKELENLIDECGKNIASHIQTPENLAKASLGLNELQRRTTKKIALFLTVPAVGIATISFLWAVHTDNLSLKLSEQMKILSIQPQIDVFLSSIKDNNERFILGIENNGVVPVMNIRGNLTIVSMNKKDYKQGETHGFSMTDDVTQEKILEPSHYVEREILIQKIEKDWVNIILFDVSFQRDIDKKRVNKQHIFFLDDRVVYNFEDAKNMKEFQPIFDNVGEFLGKLFFNQKIYSQ